MRYVNVHVVLLLRIWAGWLTVSTTFFSSISRVKRILIISRSLNLHDIFLHYFSSPWKGPTAVAPFGPLLVPELKRVVEEVQFEDIRDIALSALQALTRALGHADIETAMAEVMKAEAEAAEEEQRRIEEALEEARKLEEENRK